MELFQEPSYFYRALLANQQRNAARKQIALLLNPLQIDQTRDWARVWPQAPASLVVGAGQVGLDPSSPEALEILERHFDAQEQANTGFFAPLGDAFADVVGGMRAASRNTLTFMNDLNWNVVQRPFRAFAVSLDRIDQENQPFIANKRGDLSVDAPGYGKSGLQQLSSHWSQAYEDVGGAAGELEDIEREAGRPVNIDQDAWLPRSIDPVTHPAYTELLGRGMDPAVAYELVVARLGRPVDWEIGHRAQREAITAFGVSDPSPGRIVTPTVFEEGTIPHLLFSGLIDASVALVADPSSLVLGPLGKVSRVAKVITLADEAAGAAEATGKVGKGIAITDGRLSTILRSDVDSYLASRQYDKLSEKLATNKSPTVLLELFKDSKGTMPRQLYTDLLDAETKGQVTRVLEGQLGRTIIKKPGRPGIISSAFNLPTPGLLSGAVAPVLKRTPAFNIPLSDLTTGQIGDITSWGRMGRLARVGELAQTGGFRTAVRHTVADSPIGRWTANMTGSLLSADDLDEAIPALDDFMKGAKMSLADRDLYLDQALRLRQGDADGLYTVTTNLMKKWQTTVNDDLVANGFDEPVANVISRRVTQLFDQTAKEDLHYMIDQYGRDVPHPMSKFDANNQIIAKPMLIVEQFAGKIGLPDPREVRKVLSLTGKWGKALAYATGRGRRTMKAMTIEEADRALQDGGLVHFLDFLMKDVWKPAQLLRIAWTVRVIGDEQLRMAAAGLSSMFAHPLSYISWWAMAHGARRELKKAARSSGSELIDALARGDIDADAALFAAHDDFQNALSKGVNSWRDSSTMTKVARRYPVGDRNSPNFLEGWASQLGKYHADPVTRLVAEVGPQAARQIYHANHGLWRRLARKDPHMLDPLEQELYLEAAWVRIQREAGGAFDVQQAANGRVTGYNLTAHGDPELIKIMHEGKVAGRSIHDSRKRQPIIAALHQLQQRLPAEFMTIIPETSVSRAKTLNRYEKFLAGAFSIFMTRPSNSFSRAPTFVQSWVERMTALVPDMSLSARQHARNVLDGLIESSTLTKFTQTKVAKATRLDKLVQPVPAKVRRLYALLDGPAPKSAALDGDAADVIARGYALQKTRDLLYDVTKRHNVADALRIAAPFGEAWWEILSTWGQLIAQRPTIPRRAFQTYQGAVGSNFFSTDPATGELVFNYDPAGMLTTLATGSHPDATPVKVRGIGFASGLNMLTTTMVPSLGPVGQILAAQVLPDNEDWQTLRELLLPFGELHPEDPTGFLAELAPAWARRLAEAFDVWAGKEVFGTTTINLFRLFRYDKDLMTGPITIEEQNALMELARQKAMQIGLIRTLVQFVMPTGMHLRYDIEAQGEFGDIRQWNMLEVSREYSRMLESTGGDDVAATNLFTKIHGFNPILSDVPTSSYSRRVHTTVEGDNWATENQDLIHDYPDTAWFINPDPPEGIFDSDAWYESSIGSDPARKARTVGQWAEVSNQYLASVIYAHHRSMMEPDGITDEESVYLRTVYDWLAMHYPGFGQEVSGLLTKQDVASYISDFERMVTDERVMEYGSFQTMKTYLDVRRATLTQLEAGGLTTFGSEAAAPVAAVLKSYGSALAMSHPDFYPVWNLVLKNEFASVEEINLYELFPTRPSSAKNPALMPVGGKPSTIPTTPTLPGTTNLADTLSSP